jgi:DNA-binding transcriptional MocR family regulator
VHDGAAFPVEARWHNPTGGFFIWVELPHVVNTSELLKLAVAEEQIAFIPVKSSALALSRAAVMRCG